MNYMDFELTDGTLRLEAVLPGVIRCVQTLNAEVAPPSELIVPQPEAACERLADGIPSGKKINLSVRSESFVPMPDGAPDTIPCVCTGVYTMGKDETASFTVGPTPFHAYIDQEQGLREGQNIRLGFKKRGVFVFDRESGVRLK